jgi:hypothetical protein
MRFKTLSLAAAVAFAGCAEATVELPPAAGPSAFQAHDIADIGGGYAVEVADFNNDGLLDVIANSLAVPGLNWYENPSWEPHVISPDLSSVIFMAMADIDGDGIPEVAFQSGFAMQAARSEGLTWIAKSGGDPTGQWQVEQIDAYPTSHRLTWADLDGDGSPEIVNAPLVGPESLSPTLDQDSASLIWYGQDGWDRHMIADGDIPGVVHGIRAVDWDDDGREEILLASFEGIGHYRAVGQGDAMTFEKTLISRGHEEAAPRLGSSDAAAAPTYGGILVGSVEPWHGNMVVVYTQFGTLWRRRVIFEDIGAGHQVAVADLNGDGFADVIANDNARRTERNPDGPQGGVHVFYSPNSPSSGEWTYAKIEDEFAMNGCVSGDMNNDGRMDIICNGSGGKVRWYENLGARERP